MNAGTGVPRWREATRVLAVRLDQLGDVLMTTPALAALREGLPRAHLTLLTSPTGGALQPHLQMLDAVWTWDAPWVKRTGTSKEGAGLGADEAAMVERLAAGRFDAAVIFTVCTQSALPAALLCRQAGIPLRLAHSRENPYDLLTDWVPETDRVMPGLAPPLQAAQARHEVVRQLELVASVGFRTGDDRLRFEVQATDRQRMTDLLKLAGIGPLSPYAVFHPGASAESRRWPAERFGEAARHLADVGCSVVFTGTVDERALCDSALQAVRAPRPDEPPEWTGAGPRARALSLAGMLRLGELAAVIEGARVLVANNSAAAHLAAALGTPVVDLYALTNPQHTPWRVAARVLSHDVPCRWCLKSVCPQAHHACLRGVSAVEAADAALGLMHAGERAAVKPVAAPPVRAVPKQETRA